MSKQQTAQSGVLLLDKPEGITSHDVVDRVRKLMGIRQVGHAGTLDPFATGLLIVAVGPATRLLEYVVGLPKMYEAQITLGATSDTDDKTGTISKVSEARKVSINDVNKVLDSFLGQQSQTPPRYAAIKVRGKKLYEYARSNTFVELTPRQVTIYSISLQTYDYPIMEFTVECSSGTYIRALGRDIGQALKTGAYVSALRRTRIGKWSVADAAQLDALSKKTIHDYLLPPEELVQHLPAIALTREQTAAFRHSQKVELVKEISSTVTVFGPKNTLLGIGTSSSEDSRILRPHKIISFS